MIVIKEFVSLTMVAIETGKSLVSAIIATVAKRKMFHREYESYTYVMPQKS